MNVETGLPALLPRVIDLRRRLHTVPELAYEEHKTAALIREELQAAGIPFTAGVTDAPTATIAVLGDPAKPCVALRADIDALPIEEQTSAAYSSRHPGRMHACGHDGHSAVLLGCAHILKQQAAELPVCVKLIWQPAEETGGGAERLVRAGVLDGRIGPRVSAIFGLHGWPSLPLGTIQTRPGPLLASTDTFSVTFVGRGCHGAFPHRGRDPLVAACEAVLNLQHCVSRDLDPTEPGLVTVGTIQGGTAVNIIPDTVQITGTVRSVAAGPRAMFREAIERRCAGVAAAHGCEIRFEWAPGYPATVNDPAMADYVAKTAMAALGPKRFVPAPRPAMGGEDFAYYLERVPGCFFFLGVCPPGQDSYFSLHNNGYDFPDTALEYGIRMFVSLALNFTTEQLNNSTRQESS